MEITIKRRWNLTKEEEREVFRILKQIPLTFYERILRIIYYPLDFFFLKVYLLKEDENILGTALVSGNYLFSIAVSPDAQRKGYGKRLLEFVMTELSFKYKTIRTYPLKKDFFVKNGFMPEIWGYYSKVLNLPRRSCNI